MPGISDATAVARRFPLSSLRIGKGMAGARAVAVCGLWLPDFGDSRDDLPGHADPIASVVSRHVVGDDPEERRQHVGTAASAGAEKL